MLSASEASLIALSIQHAIQPAVRPVSNTSYKSEFSGSRASPEPVLAAFPTLPGARRIVRD
jgi:hypothetical protein